MTREKIAITGMSCLFPGADSPEGFFSELLLKRDLRSEARFEDWGLFPERYFDPIPGKADRTYCLMGGYVRGFSFDPSGYLLPPEELAPLDRSCRWSLHVARQALADAGLSCGDSLLSRCGLVLGNLSFPTRQSNRLFIPLYHNAVRDILADCAGNQGPLLAPMPGAEDVAAFSAHIAGGPAKIVQRALGLSGLSFAMDAACASSLYAVKLAADALLSGRCDVMLAGAVSAADPLFVSMGFSLFTAYPKKGVSAPLSTDTQGLYAGEGAGMFVLKRLSDAVASGDRIHAVIDGIGLSNDGRGASVLSPNKKGQVKCLCRAYERAGEAPGRVSYVECHATGTPLGDKVELSSMEEFFGADGHYPRIGSVKGNLGHLLTAAGMAGMIKVILGMAEKRMPATINIKEPMAVGRMPGDRVAAENLELFEDPERPLAAVSAFGFGGTNAHAVFSRRAPEKPSPPALSVERPRLAVTGMGCLYGSAPDLASFLPIALGARKSRNGLPPDRWHGLEKLPGLISRFSPGRKLPPDGNYIKDFLVDFFRFKVPPRESERLIAQQLILMAAADEAAKHANLSPGSDTGVLVAMEAELSLHRFRGRVSLSSRMEEAFPGLEKREGLMAACKDAILPAAGANRYTSFIGNIMACRVSSLWDFSGPAFTVSSGNLGFFHALESAWGLLAAGDCSAAILGAVDLCGSPENILLRLAGRRGEGQGLYFCGNNGMPAVCEGAGAVVIKKLEDAIEQKDKIYAVLDGLGFSAGEKGKAGRRAFDDALARTGKKPEAISLLEVCADESGGAGEEEALALASAWPDADSSVCVGSVVSPAGHAGAGAGMASFLRAVSAISLRTLPGSPGAASKMDSGPFFMPSAARPWFADEENPLRAAALLGSEDNIASCLLLSEPEARPATGSESLLRPRTLLFPLAGVSLSHLSQALDGFIDEAEKAGDIRELSARCREKLSSAGPENLRLALAADSRESLLREARAMARGLAGAMESGRDFSTPAGSFFSPSPLGKDAPVAFVYPGGFQSYPGMASGLLSLFPELWDSLLADAGSLGRLFSERLVWPRRMGAADSGQAAHDLEEMVRRPIAMFETGILVSMALTDIVTRRFGLYPRMAIGYSMGEVSMMYALNVWPREETMSRRLHRAPVFRTRLAGPMETMREAWGLPPEEEGVWLVSTILADAGTVRAAVGEVNKAFKVPRVFVTFVNTPRETVISGHPEACREVMDRVSAPAAPVDMSDAIHCELVRPEFAPLADLHRLDVNPVPGVSFYSSVRLGPLPELTTEAIAENIAEVYCRSVDFAALVENAYRDGARVFVELGPRGSCTRWVKENLEGLPHLALCTNRRGAGDEEMLARALAALFSHGLEVDLSFFCGSMEKGSGEKSLLERVSPGGADMGEKVRSACASWLPEPEPVQKPAPPEQPIIEKPRPHNPAPQPEPPPPAPREPEKAKEPAVHRNPSGNDPVPDSVYEAFSRNQEAFAQAHQAFLQRRQRALDDAASYLSGLMDLASEGGLEPASAAIAMPEPAPLERALPLAEAPSPEAAPLPVQEHAPLPAVRGELVFDQQDLLTFAEGKISDVFGPEYAAIDQYKRRVRLPMPPYLLVSRVTRLSGKTNEYKPSTMTTEYDIPENAWFSIDGQAPWAVCVESGQCDLLLISYLGIDFSCKSERVYRLLDCTLTFLGELPKQGQVLSYDISINSYARSGEGLLFFFSYRCFADGVPILNMDGGCAGFFTDRELAAGKGVIRTDAEIKERREAKRQSFTPLLSCPERSFSRDKLERIIEGDTAACFGPAYDLAGTNPSLRFSTDMMLMVDRVVSVDPAGGPWGLGEVIAEKDLEPDAWYFTCHFKDDPVLAGSLMAEGCVQLLQFFMLFLGLGTLTEDARFQPVPDLPQKVRCRGQVIPGDPMLSYRMQVKRIETSPAPMAVADVDILLNGKVVVDFKDLGVLIKEKQGEPASPGAAVRKAAPAPPAPPATRPELFTKQDLTEFAVGSLSKCFGPAFDIYEKRQPPRTPNGHLQLMDRVTGLSGTPGDFKKPATVVSEFLVPEDFWFVGQSACPARIPYSMLMEIALQPCGFVSTWMQTTQLRPDMDFFFRNLDGEGTILREADLRGRLIECTAALTLTTAAAGSIIQKFSFELRESGEPFYEGTAAFGYFVKDALTNQVGLDRGALNNPYRTKEFLSSGARRLDLSGESPWRAPANAPLYRENGPMLRFLDYADFVEGGGRYGKGYLAAVKKVDPANWFYPCHFHNDPVMPGSLGVEAILQTMRAFCLETGLGADRKNARFDMPLSKIVWKYRGQITPQNERMTLDVHIKDIAEDSDRIIVLADANLWKDEIRIYEVTDAALRISWE